MRSTDSKLSYLHILLGFMSPSISLRIVSFAAARDGVTQAPRPRACVTPARAAASETTLREA